MDTEERRKRYQAIEDHRQRPLIVYATSTRPNCAGMMAGDAIRGFIDQINAVPDGDKVDVLIHSSGGDALVAWKLMSLLRERFDDISVLVPLTGFSAATIFALGADQIVMHPHASLGPIDPQISHRSEDKNIKFAYEDIGAFLKFVREDAGITRERTMSTVIDKLFDNIDPVILGVARRASDLATAVGERMLSTHMDNKRGARKIADDLNKGFFAHGDAVSRSRALNLKLKVADRDADLEALIWDAYLGLESYMDLNEPVNYLEIYLADKAAAASLTPPPALTFPPNAPPQLIKNIWQTWANNTLQNATGNGIEVPFELVNAVLESTRVSSEFRSRGTVFAWRNSGGKVELSVTMKSQKWASIA